MKVTKENSMFVIILNNRPNPVTFDMKTNELTSFTGKVVKHMPKATFDEPADDGISDILLGCINSLKERDSSSYDYSKALEKLKTYEMFLSGDNADLIDGLRDYEIAREIPKGFIKWCRQNNKKASGENLESFYFEKKINQLALSPNVRKRLVWIGEKQNWIANDILRYDNSKYISIIMNVIETTIKAGDIWNLSHDTEQFLSFISHSIDRMSNWARVDNPFRAECIDKLFGYINVDRTLKQNREEIETMQKRERAEKILATENRFRQIADLSSENLIVVVPSTIEDFTAEGKMQHNCVGHYYHDDIASGKDFVYFIRKKEKPNHSYVTCRFHINSKTSCECRLVNNAPLGRNDNEARSLIKAVDELINKIMTE